MPTGVLNFVLYQRTIYAKHKIGNVRPRFKESVKYYESLEFVLGIFIMHMFKIDCKLHKPLCTNIFYNSAFFYCYESTASCLRCDFTNDRGIRHP